MGMPLTVMFVFDCCELTKIGKLEYVIRL